VTGGVLRRLASRRPRGEVGVTLPELLVTMMLIGLFSALVLGLVVSVTRTFTRERAATDSASIASNGMNELTRMVRAGTGLLVTGPTQAPVFIEAAPRTATLYSYIDTQSATPKPLKVQFSVDGQGRLIERRWSATTTKEPWAFATTPTSTRTVATSVVPGDTVLFSYFTAAGAPIPGTAGGGVLTVAEREQIAAVRIHLTVQTDASGKASPVALRNTVSIPNLGISRVRP
jgi:prepilin-type N-terminal cleavage/methylation domain-containing protein